VRHQSRLFAVLDIVPADPAVRFDPVVHSGLAAHSDPAVQAVLVAHIDPAGRADIVPEAVLAVYEPVDLAPWERLDGMASNCSSGHPVRRSAGVALGNNCFVQSDQNSGSRSWTAGTATVERHMRPVLAVVGVEMAVGGAPIAAAAAGDCTTGPVAAVGSLAVGSAAPVLAHNAAGNYCSSVGVVEDRQQLASPPTWS
jgi:hypothetical protein